MTWYFVGGALALVFLYWGVVRMKMTQKVPVLLNDIREGQNYARGRTVRFKGRSVRTLLGEHRWRYRGGNAYVPKKGEVPPSAIWIVPVVNPDEGPPTTVQMWVAAPQPWTRRYQKTEGWFQKLKDEFDGQTVTAFVLGTAGTPEEWTSGKKSASWHKAIRDFQERTGIETHPKAAIVSWPPKGVLPGP